MVLVVIIALKNGLFKENMTFKQGWNFVGKSVDDNTTLADLGVGPNGTVQLEMQSADPVNTPIKTYRPRQEYHMPDVITVRVQTGKLTTYTNIRLAMQSEGV